VAVKMHWSGGSLCFGTSVNHGLPEDDTAGEDCAELPPQVSSFCISSCLCWEMGHWETGYWPMWPFGVTLVTSQLCWVYLGHVPSYASLIKKNPNKNQNQNTIKNRDGGKNNPSPPHTVSRQAGSCIIFFRVDFVLPVAGSHEPQK